MLRKNSHGHEPDDDDGDGEDDIDDDDEPGCPGCPGCAGCPGCRKVSKNKTQLCKIKTTKNIRKRKKTNSKMQNPRKENISISKKDIAASMRVI